MLTNTTCPHLSCSALASTGHSGLLSGSEALASDSLSAYDCDDEGGGGWEDTNDEDGDGETRDEPGRIGLKFQVDAARAGEFHHFLMRCIVNCILQPGIASMWLTWTTFVRSIFTSRKGCPTRNTKNFVTCSPTRSPWHHDGVHENGSCSYRD